MENKKENIVICRSYIGIIGCIYIYTYWGYIGILPNSKWKLL